MLRVSDAEVVRTAIKNWWLIWSSSFTCRTFQRRLRHFQSRDPGLFLSSQHMVLCPQLRFTSLEPLASWSLMRSNFHFLDIPSSGIFFLFHFLQFLFSISKPDIFGIKWKIYLQIFIYWIETFEMYASDESRLTLVVSIWMKLIGD